MVVINLYGGAATGKSTLAANIFVECKIQGFKTELVGEYAKWLHYEQATNILQDQQYLFAEQLHRLKVLQHYGTEVAICDSPLLLSMAYDSSNDSKFNEWIIYNYNKFTNIDFVLQRDVNFFFTDGRPETTIQEAINKDNVILNILKNNSLPYVTLLPSNNNVTVVMNKIKEYL